MYNTLRYYIAPPIFLVFFTSVVQILPILGKNETINSDKIIAGILGNTFSWTIVPIFILWALASLWIPYRTTKGPLSPDGVIPVYRDNGVAYYFVSIFAYLLTEYINPGLSKSIYENAAYIFGTLNIIALFLCIYLFLTSKSNENLPKLYLFYRGCDFHPKIFGVDVKQLTNCRIGLMLWQLLPIAFFKASVESNGFNMGEFTSLISLSVYLFKFDVWESLYFWTLDIVLDRAGYYICWGCLVWVPSFYTLGSYSTVASPPKLSPWLSVFIMTIAVLAIVVQYYVDMEKVRFRQKKGDLLIWGRKPTYIKAKLSSGTSLLLTSGFWGLARHFNYTLEILFTIAIALPGMTSNWCSYLYPIFLTILLLHRIYRDEEKCRNKYGKYWDEYCSKVRYRLIPYVF